MDRAENNRGDGSLSSLRAGGRRRGLLGLAAILAFALPVAAQDDEEPAERGARLYYQQGCYGCHGYDGKSRMMPLDAETSAILQNETAFIAFLRMRAEQNPMLPSTRMPNYPASTLPDADAREILAHILAIQSPDPPVEEIPILRSLLEDAESP